MQVKILFFGKLAEIAGTETVVTQAASTDELLAILHQQYPALAEQKYLIAVNKQMITVNTILTDSSVVALLPPFSGG
jgi:molybdopterin synthase sulfur carrier subunit